ncbi:MAG TPA: hypothetical protein VM695_16665 [Phycisphaerae bacterium]|nr:hypothetical protein [Phycisphaerae bacterium]
MRKRLYLSVVVLILIGSTVALGDKKRIRLKDGEVFVGEIVEKTKEGIKVQRRLAVVFYKNEDIAAIEDADDPKTDYQKRLAAIKKDDAAAHVALGEWAMNHKMYKEAIEQFEAAIKIGKAGERVPLLLRQAKAKLKEATEAGTGEKTPEVSGTENAPFDAKQLLPMEDIHRIRLEELRDDERVTVRFENDAINKFVTKMRGIDDFKEQGFERRFRRQPNPQKARYILAKVDRDDPIKDDILVMNDPAFMREFRGPVWRWISGACGSTNCHGAAQGQGKLKLYNYPGNNVQVDYTNFLILDSYHSGGKQMIVRDNWERSLLLQYSIPRKQAEYHHPKEDMRPPFASRQVPGYQSTLRWIQELSGPKHPNYRIKHRPPGAMTPPAGLPGLPTVTPPSPSGKGPGTDPKDKGKTPKKPEVPF